ncbi:MAG TPA: DEAD/DEAH box helicase family protein [Bacteroidota bacterium]|nr:DEAD/DEAH box helicase family protein [Bacteroidota bacterium]
MSFLTLQDIVEDLPADALPANWTSLDLLSFSHRWKMWDYQQKALRNAVAVLWKYYEDFVDYDSKEDDQVNKRRRQEFARWYRVNGMETNLDISLTSGIADLISPYYDIKNKTLPFEHLFNRACFWMATGSGKTLVIVKLIELLRELIRRNEIPQHDILVLTHRDDLIEQLKHHVREFNTAHSDLFINLRELRDYAQVKRDNPALFKEREITIFYYRSDNIGDEQKEKIIDFRNYDNNGRWYLLLDEAHKGDKEDSKRQHIYSILSRNGFLFNFSATFTDARDLLTTACNFNLSEFIKDGYGKHLLILEQETRAFQDEEDYSDDEKQKIVIKSLLLLTYVKKFAASVRKQAKEMYHSPLLLTLVNSVNTEDADLKLFFREIERVGKGKTSKSLWQAAKQELWDELSKQPEFMFENEPIAVEEDDLMRLSAEDVLKSVYNSQRSGDIEILVRPSNKQELALKLKTSDRPFALIKIGDVASWLKDELAGYEIVEGFEDESFFEQLNSDESDINILMGSRSFYEGWDSNRPNVINFINIGTGTDAKKFILQSVGRGVRIEPLKDKRKRLLPLYNAKEIDEILFEKVRDKVQALETLFIFGTNRTALQTVIGHLHKESRKGEQHQLSLFVNEATKGHTLLIPTYQLAKKSLADQQQPSKFPITASDLTVLKEYVKYIGDDRVLLALHDTEPSRLRVLHESLKNPANYYLEDGQKFKNVEVLVNRVLEYFGIIPEEFKQMKELSDEIRHFKQITVSLADISELSQKVENVGKYRDTAKLEAELDGKLERREITLREYKQRIKEIGKMVKEETVRYEAKQLRIKHIANHYYIPLVLSGESERIQYIKHIIQTPSEVEFINKLEQYLEKPDNKFEEFDWWFFSKLDESLDKVYVPYYNPKLNRIAEFYPDFIFWLQKGKNYFIVFVDPKGTSHSDYQHKIDWYQRLFEESGRPKVLNYRKLESKVFVFLNTEDVAKVGAKYKPFWFDTMGSVLERISKS